MVLTVHAIIISQNAFAFGVGVAAVLFVIMLFVAYGKKNTPDVSDTEVAFTGSELSLSSSARVAQLAEVEAAQQADSGQH